MTLREAAQALLDAAIGEWIDASVPNDGRGTFDVPTQAMAALRAALAAPPEPGWEEGARAERAETVRWLTNVNDGRGMFRSRNALAEELMARAIPVPPAPTPAPEAQHAESVCRFHPHAHGMPNPTRGGGTICEVCWRSPMTL